MLKYTENSSEADNLRKIKRETSKKVDKIIKSYKKDFLKNTKINLIYDDKNKGIKNEKTNIHAARKRAAKSRLRTTGSSRLPGHGGR